jgi:hypothetical protein
VIRIERPDDGLIFVVLGLRHETLDHLPVFADGLGEVRNGGGRELNRLEQGVGGAVVRRSAAVDAHERPPLDRRIVLFRQHQFHPFHQQVHLQLLTVPMENLRRLDR